MGRGRRPKAVKPPTKFERGEKLRELILKLSETLAAMGLIDSQKPLGPVRFIADPIKDPRTGGMIGHVEEPLATYIQRVSIRDNFSQRPPFDHVTDPIYKRLISDFIEGAVMPESKVAALSRTAADRKVLSLDEPEITYSIIDGLQRLYCYCIAVLLTIRRDQLVSEDCIPKDAWEYFKDSVSKSGDPRSATEKLLQAVSRHEVFYQIDLAGLLHYMVTFNTGQRRMDLSVQLEIMKRPLIDELEDRAKIPIWRDIQKMPGQVKPRDQFAASHLVMATQAFFTNDAHVTPTEEAERFLDKDRRYLDNVGDIKDVVTTLKRITTEINSDIVREYDGDSNRQGILSNNITFLVPLAAACGYVRSRGNMKILEGALDKLQAQLLRPADDPLNLSAYYEALQNITASRGKTSRRLVYDTFLRFFNGATSELEWLDTARQITGVDV